MTLAWKESSVSELRRRKKRSEKPFAVMAPSIEFVEKYCRVSHREKALLLSSASPIVLVRKREPDSSDKAFCPSLAPGNPLVGIMLPFSPLHEILLRDLSTAVVATSGNLTEEPLCYENEDALRRLGSIADAFLLHNRKIVRPVDDSVVRVVDEKPLVLRLGRGYAPFPVFHQEGVDGVLGVGGQLKNTIALGIGDTLWLSQHIGDMESIEGLRSFQRTVEDFRKIYSFPLSCVAHDCHPDYITTMEAGVFLADKIQVQHHHAYIVSAMVENGLKGPVLGIAWDGTGWGEDKVIWGGEWLVANRSSFQRVAHWAPFPLPGGEKAVKEPHRTALGLLWSLGEERLFEDKGQGLPCLESFSQEQHKILLSMLKRKIQCPLTTSMGRLFDGVASLLGLCQVATFEGQAAMAVEFCAESSSERACYPYRLFSSDSNENCHHFPPGPIWICDWRPIIRALLKDLRRNTPVEDIAAKFHNTIIEIAVESALKIGIKDVVLSGGCFQNARLLKGLCHRLEREGFHPIRHRAIPTNDAGLAVGQVAAAAAIRKGERHVFGCTGKDYLYSSRR